MKKVEKILVTGGAGFIGANFVRYMLQTYDTYHIVNLDKLTYAGNLHNLVAVEDRPNYTFIQGDICNPADVEKAVDGVDYIIHFAAESHVDRSIFNSAEFIRTNVMGTHNLLEYARKQKVSRFIHVSTDEVYGSLGSEGFFTEKSSIAPNSPYSASKASSDLLVRSYCETFGFPGIITRCSNNYGPYQFPEKLIPLMITNAMQGNPLPVYGDGLNVRDWLHVSDHCRAIDMVLHMGKTGEVYNIGGNNEKPNIEVVTAILDALKKPKSLINFVSDRLGHDRRYAIDSSKIQNEVGWKPRIAFVTGLRDTIQWYRDNSQWWQNIRSGEYLDFNRKHYS